MKPGLKYFIFAAVLGLVAVFLVHSYIKSRIGEPRVTATNPVVVAEADIAPGTAVSSGMVRVATYPGNLVPDPGHQRSQAGGEPGGRDEHRQG